MSNEDITRKAKLTPSVKSQNGVDNQVKVKKESPSDLLWNELRKTDLNMFGLDNQFLENYCDRIVGNPNELTLKLKKSKSGATSVVSLLSQVLFPKYEVYSGDMYITVKRNEKEG